MKKLFLMAVLFLSMSIFFTACSSDQEKAATTQLDKTETYTCTMHNEVMSDHPADCPICGMKLTKQKMTAQQEKMMQERTAVKPKE